MEARHRIQETNPIPAGAGLLRTLTSVSSRITEQVTENTPPHGAGDREHLTLIKKVTGSTPPSWSRQQGTLWK